MLQNMVQSMLSLIKGEKLCKVSQIIGPDAELLWQNSLQRLSFVHWHSQCSNSVKHDQVQPINYEIKDNEEISHMPLKVTKTITPLKSQLSDLEGNINAISNQIQLNEIRYSKNKKGQQSQKICKICNTAFKSEVTFQKHLASSSACDRVRGCKHCGILQDQSYEVIQRHEAKCKSNPCPVNVLYQCRKCSKKFKYQRNYEKHKNVEQSCVEYCQKGKVMGCKFCGILQGQSKKAIETHENKCHLRLQDDNGQKRHTFKCQKCAKVFQKKEFYVIHVANAYMCDKMSGCKHCGLFQRQNQTSIQSHQSKCALNPFNIMKQRMPVKLKKDDNYNYQHRHLNQKLAMSCC